MKGGGVELVVSCTARKKVLISILIGERGGGHVKGATTTSQQRRWSKMRRWRGVEVGEGGLGTYIL